MTAGIYVAGAVVLIGLIVAVVRFVMYLIDKPEGGHHRPPWWRRKSRAMLWSESRHNALRPSLWQRWREERAQERAQDALNLRLLQDIHNGLRGEAERAATSPMRRAEWPLQPLPPGAEEYADHFHRPVPPEVKSADPTTMCRECANGYCGRAACVPDDGCSCLCSTWAHASEDDDREGMVHMYQLKDGQIVPAESYVPPEDPLDVATPEQVADAYVGDLGPAELEETPGPGGGAIVAENPSVPSARAEPEPAPLTDYREETGSWSKLVDAVIPKDGA